MIYIHICINIYIYKGPKAALPFVQAEFLLKGRA